MSEVQKINNMSEDRYWITNEGRELLMSEMETSHVFYSLRMIYNALCPPGLVVGESPNIWKVGSVTAKKARALCKELSSRKNIPAWMEDEIEQMSARILETKEINGNI